jgi:hypothetical protein
MDTSDIVTSSGLEKYLYELARESEQSDQVSLEQFLRSLLALVEERPIDTPSYGLLGRLCGEAFRREPPPFDEAWMAYDELPEETKDYEQFRLMLLYQIADLRRMKDVGILDLDGGIRWMGVDSPTGQRWYNTTVSLYLRCGAPVREEATTTYGWRDWIGFLEDGQSYE